MFLKKSKIKLIPKGVEHVARSYVNKDGKRFFGAAADAHHTKELGFGSAEEYADAAFEDGFDAGYQMRKAEERDRWKANQEAKARRRNIKVS